MITPERRRSVENGIWLCQQCSRLVDADDSGHSIAKLLEWKTFAEAAAHVEVRGFSVRRGRDFCGLERKMPELVAEMKADLAGHPFTREFIVLSKNDVYHASDTPFFTYFSDDHPELLGKLQIARTTAQSET